MMGLLISMKLRTIGALLLAGAVFVAMVMQFTGHGVITSRAPVALPQTIPGPQGSTIVRVQAGPATVFHLNRILPLMGIAILGLVCLLLRGRDETAA
jgi:hypothetical protein